MPPRIELEHQRDFTGGLNINTDPYDLAPNESFDLQNVDIDRRGGFSIRRGSKRWITTTTGMANIDTMYTYVDASAVRHLLAASSGQVKRWDGAAWVQIQAAIATGTTQFVEMNGVLYLCHNTRNTKKWTGSGSTSAMTTTFNDNLAAPTGGNTVPGRCAAVFNGVLVSGNVFDPIDSAVHASRIHWSHPGHAEDWRTNDWIDIDPDDNSGQITALVPLGDRLIIFKERAIYALHGFPPEGFSVTNLTKSVGTATFLSVTARENVIYFWDIVRGAHALDSKGVTWIFEPLYPYIDDNKINMPFSWQVICQWHNDRVWFSIPWKAAPYANTFIGLVFAPNVGKQGAWTLHTKTLFSFHEHRASTGGDAHLLGGNGGFVMEIDVENYYLDEDTAGNTSRINAWYTTRWFDGSNPALRKRWKRPIVVVGNNATQEFKVDVFSDYDPTHVKRTFSLFTDVTGTDGVWDVNNWDAATWAAEIGDPSVVLKGSPLSIGTARALRFSNVTSAVDWRVHGLTMKWVPKRIRN